MECRQQATMASNQMRRKASLTEGRVDSAKTRKALFITMILMANSPCYYQGSLVNAFVPVSRRSPLPLTRSKDRTMHVPRRPETRKWTSQPMYNDAPLPDLAEVDVLYGYRTSLVYDPSLGRYVPTSHDDYQDKSFPNNINGEGPADLDEVSSKSQFTNQIRSYVYKSPPAKVMRRIQSRIIPTLKASFFPEGVSPSYYRFVRWRVLQRFVNANVHVFGTQSLLLGLGLKSHSLGLSAALNWVLKDALGKITRMMWASKMGRKFDSDAKRWRFRSSLLFALGNFLEIVTYIFPQLFLLWATLANCFKQVSMLTSSSTRTALYNSFRDGTRENIGDIIAKGEAQIAVVDLLGIASGVVLSRAVGMSVRNVLGVYFALQVTEIFCMYHEIGAVEFRVLNFERLVKVVNQFVESYSDFGTSIIPTPKEMAKKEKIFLPPKHLERRAIAFGSLGRAKLAPDELEDLMRIFRNEKYLMVVGADVKNHPRRQATDPRENCHIVLHSDANNADIVKTVLALSILRRKLADMDPPPVRSRDCMDVIAQSKQEADILFPLLLKSMASHGWAPPARFMFGRVTMRAEWPLSKRSDPKTATSAQITESQSVDLNGTETLLP